MIIDIHMGAWFLAVILFIVAYILVNQGKDKAVKITAMIMRTLYLVILFTGGFMLYYIGWSGPHILKTALGIATITFLEIGLARKIKGKPTGTALILLAISLSATVFYGFYL